MKYSKQLFTVSVQSGLSNARQGVQCEPRELDLYLDPILRSLPSLLMRTTFYPDMYARHDLIIKSAWVRL